MSSVTAPRSIDISPFHHSKVTETVEVPEGVQLLEDGQSVPEGFGLFRILTPLKGDERLTWDSRSLSDIRGAKQLFVDLIKKGMTPFRVGTNGKATSEVMSEFDPHAEEVIFLPTKLVVGG